MSNFLWNVIYHNSLVTLIRLTEIMAFFFLQGVLLSVPEAMEDMMAMKRLWVHEVLRVYYDRLVDDSDRSWIIETLRQVCHDKLDEDINVMFSRLKSKDSPMVCRFIKQFYYRIEITYN